MLKKFLFTLSTDFHLLYKLSGFTIVRVWAYTYAVSPGKSMGFSQRWFCRARNTVKNNKCGEYCELIVTLFSHWSAQNGMLRPSVLLVNQV